MHRWDRPEPRRGDRRPVRSGEVQARGEFSCEQGQHADQAVEIRARSDALLGIPVTREYPVDGRVRRGYIRRWELL